jgi:transposase
MKKLNKEKANSDKRLQEIGRYVKLVAGCVAMQQVEKLVSTDERKAIWFLCSGKFTREEIASESGVSLRTVTTFIDMAKTFGLLEEEKAKGGHPRRVIDYCPTEWKEHVTRKRTEKTESMQRGNTGP